jgi:hypothetical protein
MSQKTPVWLTHRLGTVGGTSFLFSVLVWYASSVSVFTQGFLTFHNRALSNPTDGSIYDAPVTLPTGQGAGTDFTAGLYLVSPAGLTLLETSPFRPNRTGFFTAPLAVEVPGIPPGSPGTFRVRVWEGRAGSYETAVANGFCHGEFPSMRGNNEVTIVLGRRPFPADPIAPPSLDGLLPLTMPCIPEPSIFAMALAGAAFLLAFTNTNRRV